MTETYHYQQVFDSQRSKMQGFISKCGGGGEGGGIQGVMASHLLYHILFPPGLLFPSASQLPLFIVLLPSLGQ